MDRNYLSAGSDTDVELGDPVDEKEFNPINAEQEKRVRHSGKPFTFKESHFTSKISITDRSMELRIIWKVQACVR